MPAAKRAATFEGRFSDAKGVRMRYYLGGSGPALVLIHGLGGAASNWGVLGARLARRFRIVVPDLPGHGGSTALPAAPNLRVFADRVGLVAEREEAWPAVIVGHSLGALVALRLALLRPSEIAGLVLAGAAGFSPTGRRAKHALVVSSLVRPGRLVAPYSARVARRRRLRRLTLGWGSADAEALSPAAVEGFLATLDSHTDTLSAARALVEDDLSEALEGLRTPCLVLWGTRDELTPIGDAFGYARRLGAPLRAIPDCGHLLTGERPDVCADAIESFCRGLGHAGGG